MVRVHLVARVLTVPHQRFWIIHLCPSLAPLAAVAVEERDLVLVVSVDPGPIVWEEMGTVLVLRVLCVGAYHRAVRSNSPKLPMDLAL